MEYGCIGEKLPHSFSKEIHEKIGGYSYELKELTPAALAGFLEKKDFRAINVTIPYKEAVIPYLDEIDSMAKVVGAVNTIVRRGDSLYGYNTDMAGMEQLLEKMRLSLTGKKVLVLGTGGTSKTARAVAQRANAREIITVSRTAKKDAVTYDEAYQHHADADIIINTTPCGMYPSPYASPIDPARFPNLSGVVDAVYNPLETKLAAAAKVRGINAACGLYMLVAQAVAAYGIFMQETAVPGLTDRIYAELLREKQNFVLIGMPGSGKSTIGKQIADDTGRELIDTDSLIIKREGMEISDLFAKKGEAYFREAEAAVIGEAAKRSGCVISTGGGAVLRDENIRALKMNGRLYFLDRPPALLLPTEDRPLANTREAIARRYRERYQIYLQAADDVIPVENDPVAAANEAERRHGYESVGH